MCERDTTTTFDRELPLELLESPVSPSSQFRMHLPLNDGDDYSLEINGEVLWNWRAFKSPSIFHDLNTNLEKIGYDLKKSSETRLGEVLSLTTRRFVKAVTSKSNTRARKSLRSSSWKTVSIKAVEVTRKPGDFADLNSQLQRRCSELEALASCNENPGKQFTEVQKRQQQRQLLQVRSKAENALRFTDSYGFIPKSLEVLVQGQDKTITFDLSGPTTVTHAATTPETTQTTEQTGSTSEIDTDDDTTSENASEIDTDDDTTSEDINNTEQPALNQKMSAYASLLDKKQEEIKSLLCLMDKHTISFKAYHEMTQLYHFLPRCYLVEGCGKTLDSQWNVVRTHGECHGAQLAFKDLLEEQLRKHIASSSPSTEKPVRVKISGDGAKMSHTSNLFVLSFSLLDEGNTALTSSGNHTIGTVVGPEDHDILKEALSDVIRDINQVIEAGEMMVDGQRVKVDIFLGGDYKFLLMAMGMKCANSKNSCLYCKVAASDRSDMSKNCSDFESAPLARSLSDNWIRQPGCKRTPYFNIDVYNAVIDELHLMLRVTDKFEEGLIFDILQWDNEENENKPASQRQQTHINDFLAVVKSLSVTFAIYKKDNKYEWTSLHGGEKRLLLKKLPSHFNKFLKPDRVEVTKKLWEDFGYLLKLLTLEPTTAETVQEFETKAKEWGRSMVRMSGTGPGYKQKSIITPYMHAMIFHVPTMLRKHGSLRKFSGQGVEKKNDDYRRYFHRKINRWDAAANLLLMEKRQEVLKPYEREKRKYRKSKTSFWEEGGKQAVAAKIPRISTTRPE